MTQPSLTLKQLDSRLGVVTIFRMQQRGKTEENQFEVVGNQEKLDNLEKISYTCNLGDKCAFFSCGRIKDNKNLFCWNFTTGVLLYYTCNFLISPLLI